MSGNEFELPLVSIIINCYNGEAFLREAMDSVFAQSYQNFEIIFWDNVSTDNSAIVAQSYGPKVKYFKAVENRPLGEARNYAMEKASGTYVSFIDCDDIWLPTKLQTQVALMETNQDYILSYGSVEEISIDGEHFRDVYTLYESGFILDKLLLQFDIHILSCMINMKLLRLSSLHFDPNITASEEYCLFMQLGSQYKIGVIREIIAKYRVHSNSLTSKSSERLGKERRYTLDKILSTNKQLYLKYQLEFNEAFARANYYDAKWHMQNGEHIKAFKKLLPVSTRSIRYFMLLVLTLMPIKVWEKVHLKFRNRV